MKNIKIHFALLLLLVTIAPLSQPWAADSEKRIPVASLLRTMGYGAGIHNFRNYLLRGTEKYRERAEENFSEAGKTVSTLRTSSGLTAKGQRGLDDIDAVIQADLAKLLDIQGTYERERSLARVLKRVDQQTKIDDGPVVAGLAVLQAD